MDLKHLIGDKTQQDGRPSIRNTEQAKKYVMSILIVLRALRRECDKKTDHNDVGSVQRKQQALHECLMKYGEACGVIDVLNGVGLLSDNARTQLRSEAMQCLQSKVEIIRS